jgi:hypothetical protein
MRRPVNQTGSAQVAAFAPLGSVLSGVMSGLALDRRLKEHTLINLWPTFVSSAIAQRSRPIFIDSSRLLVIAVADASCGQELSLSKTQVLAKLIPTGRALGVEIAGLRLDLKHYHRKEEENFSSAQPGRDRLPEPKEADLAQIILPQEDLDELRQLAEELKSGNGDPDLAARMLKLFEGELKLRQWQFLNGYPVCDACGNPARKLHAKRLHSLNQTDEEPAARLCQVCFYSSL